MASTTSKAEIDANAMPPPPVPAFNKLANAKILQPEFEALARCLKDAIVKTGQIYGFYSEARKLGIMNHIPNPPQKLTAALGRDIERYDQLCDSIETQLHRAISILKRDLRREEQKKQEEERRNAAEPADIQPMIEDTIQPPDTENTVPKNSSAALLSRRPSTVSISSLQRPQFPLKLDLSSASLRITEEEATMFRKDLGSPVTLAPKSARPTSSNDFPSDLMIAFSNAPIQSDLIHGSSMDLTMSESTQEPSGLPLQLGNASEDKAMELDLEMDIDMANMTELFGDTADSDNSTNTVDELFIPLKPDERNQVGGPGNLASREDDLSGFEIDASDAELFGEFNPDTELDRGGPVNNTTGVQSGTSVTSPSSLLAQFSASDLDDNKASISANNTLSSVSGEGFDMTSIDLSNLGSSFFAAGQNSEMDFRVDMGFMGIDTGVVVKTEPE